MAPIRSLTLLTFATFILDASARFAPAHKIHQAHKHEARDLGKRQVQVGPPHMPIPRQAVPTRSAADALTYITPSPGAKPIAVTEQSQIVTSFVPQYTLCELPPLAFFSASPVRPSAGASTAPYRNYSISVPEGNGTCTTVYEPTHTMVCATTLTGLFDKWTVTQCDQDLTFSTQYGYVLVTKTPTPAAAAITPSIAMTKSGASSVIASSIPTLNDTIPSVLKATNATLQLQNVELIAPRQASPDDLTITPGPEIETLTSYYLARWQDLTAGTVPSEIDLKVCHTFDNGTEKCVREQESWHTSLVTATTTSTTSISINTTIAGPSAVIAEGQYMANITEVWTIVSVSTTVDVEYVTEYETTHTTKVDPTITSTSPTVYLTSTVEEASETAAPLDDATSTITIRSTTTIVAETRTTTIPSLSASAPVISAAAYLEEPEEAEVTVEIDAPQSTDYVSLLGVGGERR